jgi:hypothetical protein
MTADKYDCSPFMVYFPKNIFLAYKNGRPSLSQSPCSWIAFFSEKWDMLSLNAQIHQPATNQIKHHYCACPGFWFRNVQMCWDPFIPNLDECLYHESVLQTLNSKSRMHLLIRCAIWRTSVNSSLKSDRFVFLYVYRVGNNNICSWQYLYLFVIVDLCCLCCVCQPQLTVWYLLFTLPALPFMALWCTEGIHFSYGLFFSLEFECYESYLHWQYWQWNV